MRRCFRPLAGSELRELWLRGRSGTLTPLACRQPSALVSPLRGQRGRQWLDSAADAAAHSNCVQCTRNLLNGHGIVCPIPGSVFVGVNHACQSWHVTLKRNLGRCTTLCAFLPWCGDSQMCAGKRAAAGHDRNARPCSSFPKSQGYHTQMILAYIPTITIAKHRTPP